MERTIFLDFTGISGGSIFRLKAIKDELNIIVHELYVIDSQSNQLTWFKHNWILPRNQLFDCHSIAFDNRIAIIQVHSVGLCLIGSIAIYVRTCSIDIVWLLKGLSDDFLQYFPSSYLLWSWVKPQNFLMKFLSNAEISDFEIFYAFLKTI